MEYQTAQIRGRFGSSRITSGSEHGARAVGWLAQGFGGNCNVTQTQLCKWWARRGPLGVKIPKKKGAPSDLGDREPSEVSLGGPLASGYG